MTCLSPPAQFWDRIKLYMMPSKHQPDFSYLRHVPLRRIHLFTLVQIACLAVLWILKSTFMAIIFPVMVCGKTCCSRPASLRDIQTYIRKSPFIIVKQRLFSRP